MIVNRDSSVNQKSGRPDAVQPFFPWGMPAQFADDREIILDNRYAREYITQKTLHQFFPITDCNRSLLAPSCEMRRNKKEAVFPRTVSPFEKEISEDVPNRLPGFRISGFDARPMDIFTS